MMNSWNDNNAKDANSKLVYASSGSPTFNNRDQNYFKFQQQSSDSNIMPQYSGNNMFGEDGMAGNDMMGSFGNMQNPIN